MTLIIFIQLRSWNLLILKILTDTEKCLPYILKILNLSSIFFSTEKSISVIGGVLVFRVMVDFCKVSVQNASLKYLKWLLLNI